MNPENPNQAPQNQEPAPKPIEAQGWADIAKEVFAKEIEPGYTGKPPAAPEPPADKPAPKPDAKPSDPYEKLLLDDQRPAPAPGDVADDEPDPEGLSEKNKPHWSKLKSERKAFKLEAAKLRQEFEEFKTKANPDEFQKIKQERDDFDARLAAANLERHPKFQEKYDKQHQALVAMAKKAGGEQGEKLAHILAMADSPIKEEQLNDLIPTLPPTAQSRLGAILNDIEVLQTNRSSELAQASERYKQITENEKEMSQRQQIARSDQAKRAFSEEINRWSDPKDGIPALQERQGDAEWNKQVEQAKVNARAIFDGNVPDLGKLSRLSIQAAVFPQVLRQAAALTNKVADLEATISRLSSAQPGPSQLRGGEGATAPDNTSLGWGEIAIKSAIEKGLVR